VHVPGQALRAVQQLGRIVPQDGSCVNTEIVCFGLGRHEYRTKVGGIMSDPLVWM
jgi:hypothetical protein